MAKTGCAGSATTVAPICLNFGITAPVLSWVITWRGRIEMKSPLRTTVPGASPSAWRPAIFSTSVRPISSGRNYVCLQRLVFFEATHAEDTEPNDVAFIIHTFGHCIVARFFLITRGVGKPHFKVVRFRVEPDFYFFGHKSSPALGLSVK